MPLWAAGFLAAIVLCGSEATLGGWKNALVPDQFSALALTVSFREALLEPQIPPRVSPLLSGSLGNPYLQFYSPLSLVLPSALSLAFGGDVMAGYSAAALFYSALSFVYAWRLSRLLTLSDSASAAGAALFVTAPYFLCDRVLRGAWTEFAAFSMLPMTLFCLLRWAGGGGARRLLAASGALAALFLTHLITSVFFCLFFAAFSVMWALNALWRVRKADGRAASGTLGKFARRAARAFSAAAFAAAMGMCYLAPMALYGDLVMKAGILAGGSLSDASPLVSPLLVLSAADTPPPALPPDRAIRFQLGTALVLSVLAYAGLALREKAEGRPRPPAYALPLFLTAALAAGWVLMPELAERVFPPANLAQFSPRFIMFFVLAALPMAALAIKGWFPPRPGGGDRARRGAALVLALFAAISAAPYLYPSVFIRGWPKKVSEAGLLAEGARLSYGNDAYLRYPPPKGSPDWAPPGTRPLPPLPREGSSARRVFAADLSAAPRLPDGAVPLDVLYYPGLQKLSFKVDGRE
ncbi:MAG: hypothetical protein LBW85_00125, partial [Deltaproteobacteria bacterium]|nr:hypothetical protein [Deltaproteobacteria bacterium]